MDRDFEVRDGIYLVKSHHHLDLHNHYDFTGFTYSVRNRSLVLTWRRGSGEWIPSDSPGELIVTFSEVSEFRFLPRDPELPFSEDDCVSSFGYWVDEDWAEDGFLQFEATPGRAPDPSWLPAVAFQSGAVLAVQAGRATAQFN